MTAGEADEGVRPASQFRGLTSLYEGWTRLMKVVLHTPDGAHERHIEDHGRAIAVLPYDPDRRTVVLVRQPRAPVWFLGEADLLEAIAGRIEGEDSEDCARREALEEAGVRLEALEPLGRIWMMPSLSTERIDYYLGAYSQASRIAAGGGLAAEGEQTEPVELSLEALSLQGGPVEILDGKALILLQALRIRRPELFG